jgi:hypothetical protein
MSSLYFKLKNNPPAITVKDNAREVVIKTISVMCDNVSYLTFRKNADGDFRVSGSLPNGMGACLSNWQMEADKVDLEWTADEQDWNKVIDIINTGTSQVEIVRSR